MAEPTSFKRSTSKVAPKAEAEGKQLAFSPLKKRVPLIPWERESSQRISEFYEKREASRASR